MISVNSWLVIIATLAKVAPNVHTLGFRIDMGWFYGIFLLFILVASSNAVNLTIQT